MPYMEHRDEAGLLRRHGYKELKKIGEGSFGKAVLVQATDGSKLVSKMVDVSMAGDKERQEAVKEGKLLSSLKHPYIVRYRESFQDAGWLCILMDFCEGGDLTKQIQEAKRRNQSIPEDQVMRWFTMAVLALKYIHDRHILHRDLKPQNFFLTKSGALQMGDFGIAKELAWTIAVAKTQIGTPYYLSPELCQEQPYTWPSDVWAMGCILYEMCVRRVPFDGSTITNLVKEITRGRIPQLPPQYSSFLRQLCNDMLARNPQTRASTEAILARPKIQEVVRLLNAEEPISPTSRGDANDPYSFPAPLDPHAAAQLNYKKDDMVEYLSSAHKSWLPAIVTQADIDGRIIINLKPNTWLTKADQADKVRPRIGAQPRRNGRDANAGWREPSGSKCPSRCASPKAHAGSRPASRCESPHGQGMRNRPPSAGPARTYVMGDQVEFWSNTHEDWMGATVINTDSDGRVILDVKPNTWIGKEEQQLKVRPRRSRIEPPSRAGGSSWRSPSTGVDRACQGTPQMRRSPSVGPPPGRARSPLRTPSGPPGSSPCAGPPSRAASPRIRPPMPRVVVESPLRRGGAAIAGV